MGRVKKSVCVRSGEETVDLKLWYIDGIDICSRLWFEFANPHYSPSLSEDGIINIVSGTHAPMNTKVLFAFSGGFAPKSIRKICTLHQYEFENLALLKLSQWFSPTQHISKNVKLKVNIFILAILFVSQWFITSNFFFFFFWSVYFDLGPVKDHNFLFFFKTGNDDLEETSKIWVSKVLLITVQFIKIKKIYIHHYACTRTHTLWSPALACPCSSHCLQTELPWKPLAGLSTANQSSHTLAFIMLLPPTQVLYPILKTTITFLKGFLFSKKQTRSICYVPSFYIVSLNPLSGLLIYFFKEACTNTPRLLQQWCNIQGDVLLSHQDVDEKFDSILKWCPININPQTGNR